MTAQLQPVALPRYTREAWERMRPVATDGDDMGETFEEFERANAVRRFEAECAGRPVEELLVELINVDALIEWCAAHGVPIDSRGCAYAAAAQAEREARERGLS